MPMPQITAFYTALLALLVVVLALRVVRGRWSSKVGLGDGGDPAMARSIRVHANAVENLPLALLLLLLLELTNVDGTVVHVFGVVLLVARVLHAFGLSRSAGVSAGRFLGALLTWVAMLAMSVLLLYRWFLLQTLV